MDTGNYPSGVDVKTSSSGMSPEMEAKFLWFLDNVVDKVKLPFAGQGPVQPQTVVGFTDAQNKALDMAMNPFDEETGYKQYLNEYQDYVTKGITDQFDTAINQSNMSAASSGAFGGDRSRLMEGILQGEKASAVGESLAAGFNNAFGLYNQGIASMMGAGSVQQQQMQQQSDMNYQAYLQNRQDPYQRLAFIGDAFTGTPSGQMAMTMGTTPMTNPLAQALGAGLGIMGAGVASGYNVQEARWLQELPDYY